MTDAAAEHGGDSPAKGGKLPLVLGIVLGLAGAAGGWFVTTSGVLSGGPRDSDQTPATLSTKTAFVPVPELTISLGRDGGGVRHLRFRAQLEVTPTAAADVEALLPRVSDVLNGYLRAIEIAEIEDPAALVRIRAQMLRRVQIVVGEGKVVDLLVMEFVLN